MYKRTLILCIGFFTFAVTPVFGAKWYWEDNDVIKLKSEYAPYSDIKNSSGEIGITQTKLSFIAPVILKSDFFLGLGVKHRSFYFHYKNISPFNIPSTSKIISQEDLPGSLYTTDLVIGTSYDFSKQLYIYTEFTPGIHSDLENIGNKDINFEGLFFFGYTSKSGTEYRFGGGYNHSFGEHQIYPLLGLHWPITEKSAVDVLLPSHSMFRFKLTKLAEIGMKAKLISSEFRLKNESPWNDDILKYSQIEIGPYTDFNIYRSLILRLESGYVFERILEFYDDGYDHELRKYDLEEKLFLGFSIRWAL